MRIGVASANVVLLERALPGHPMQLVAVDILGPFPKLEAGNSYILVAADYCTRWVEAYTIPHQEATTVAGRIVNEFFFRLST